MEMPSSIPMTGPLCWIVATLFSLEQLRVLRFKNATMFVEGCISSYSWEPRCSGGLNNVTEYTDYDIVYLILP